MTLAYFCLSALSLLPSSTVSNTDLNLSAVEVMLKPKEIEGYVDWVYKQQIISGGFRGSDSMQGTEGDNLRNDSNSSFSESILLVPFR